MNELITVIINVYNAEKFIKKCLDSIINQTYKNIEILIINDGSIDKTLDICESYKDKRIKIITTSNQGLALSRNTGIDNAKGDYLYFIDADDYIEIDAIEYLYKLIKKHNADISTCKHLVVYNYDNKIIQKPENIENIDSVEMLKKMFLRQDNTISIWNKLIKKELFDNLRFEKRIINDVTYTHKIIIKAKNIVCSNQIKYYYLKNEQSICATKYEDLDRIMDLYKASIERYEYVKERYPDLIENNYVLLELITRLYLRKNPNIIKYLNKQGAKKLYRKLFSFKLLKCQVNYKQKIKLISFWISPKLNKTIYNMHLKKYKSKIYKWKFIKI